jgi:hypothetical protein
MYLVDHCAAQSSLVKPQKIRGKVPITISGIIKVSQLNLFNGAYTVNLAILIQQDSAFKILFSLLVKRRTKNAQH